MDKLMAFMHILLASAGIVAIACRLHGMSRSTRGVVRTQHALLLGCIAFSLAVPAHYAVVPVLAGVVAFLLLSASRWRHGAPEDTTRPGELVDSNLKHIAGGRKFDR